MCLEHFLLFATASAGVVMSLARPRPIHQLQPRVAYTRNRLLRLT